MVTMNVSFHSTKLHSISMEYDQFFGINSCKILFRWNDISCCIQFIYYSCYWESLSLHSICNVHIKLPNPTYQWRQHHETQLWDILCQICTCCNRLMANFVWNICQCIESRWCLRNMDVWNTSKETISAINQYWYFWWWWKCFQWWKVQFIPLLSWCEGWGKVLGRGGG